MLRERKFVLVLHHEIERGQLIKEGLLGRGVSAWAVSEPARLSAVVHGFRIHSVITDLEPGSPLEKAFLDWKATPTESEFPRVLNLREVEFPGIEALCQAVAMDLERT